MGKENSFWRMRLYVLSAFPPSNGAFPISMVYVMMPIAQMSTSYEYARLSLEARISGAM